MTNRMAKMTAVCRGLLEHRRLPFALAVAAIILMLPALPMGLVGDDLTQRINQFPPEQLPPRILETGFVARDSGHFGSVLNNLFGFCRGAEGRRRAMDYGI